MENYYNRPEEFLLSLKILVDELDELEKFSVWQDDIANEELALIKSLTNRIEGILERQIDPINLL